MNIDSHFARNGMLQYIKQHLLVCECESLNWCWIDWQIKGGWFSGSKALRSLRLEGNLLTSLDSGSFPLNDLKYLESLDLSDNLIQHLGTNRSVSLLPESDFQNVHLSYGHFSCCQLQGPCEPPDSGPVQEPSGFCSRWSLFLPQLAVEPQPGPELMELLLSAGATSCLPVHLHTTSWQGQKT